MAKKSVAPMTVDAAIKRAYEYCSRHRHEGHLAFAATYLAAIPQAVSRFPEQPDHVKQTQIEYALGNMAAWKGDEARRVKAVLMAYTKKRQAKATLKPADRKKRSA